MGNRRWQIVSWAASFLACCYFAWVWWHLGRATKVFADLFGSLGVELPLPTRVVVSSHGWLYPILFLGAGSLVIVKEFFMGDKKFSLVITSIVAFSVLFVSDWAISALYAPLFGLIEKLSR